MSTASKLLGVQDTSEGMHTLRVERYHKSNYKKGLVQTKLWIPEQDVDAMKQSAAKLRSEHADRLALDTLASNMLSEK